MGTKNVYNQNLKCEITALAFGVILILITFGDSHLTANVGNLDTIFGTAHWKMLDIFLPSASIFLFLLYGKLKGGFKFSLVTIAIFVSYIAVLALVILDDVSEALNLSINLTRNYWVAVEWIYPLYSFVAFFLFGSANHSSESKELKHA